MAIVTCLDGYALIRDWRRAIDANDRGRDAPAVGEGFPLTRFHLLRHKPRLEFIAEENCILLFHCPARTPQADGAFHAPISKPALSRGVGIKA
jgi:hypothetical protein